MDRDRWLLCGVGAVGIALLVVTSFGLLGDKGVVVERDGRYVLVAPENRSEAGVGFPGARVRLVGDCVGLELGDRGGVVVIWPHGTKLVATDPLALEVPGLGRVAVGDEVWGGGADYDTPDPLPAIEVPDRCRVAPVVSFTPNQ